MPAAATRVSFRARRRSAAGAAAALAAAVLVAGGVGVYRYAWNFWVYRGFPAPRDPAWVRTHGAVVRIEVASAALSGRSQEVLVYLPPGYRGSTRRYPALYLLHGFPGRPNGFLGTVRIGVLEDELVARRRAQPLLLVMPSGSTGFFTDQEWANGVRPGNDWETFVARDVVRAVDRRFRTVASGAGRGIAGLSEGGYGALNIALHHPGEFDVVESWSGYTLADPVPAIFGRSPARLAANSPALELAHVATALRRAGSFFWLYSGTKDTLRTENASFAAELRGLGIRNRFFLVPGGHDWRVWRHEARAALVVVAAHLRHG